MAEDLPAEVERAKVEAEAQEGKCPRCPHKAHAGYVCSVYTNKEARQICGCREIQG